MDWWALVMHAPKGATHIWQRHRQHLRIVAVNHNVTDKVARCQKYLPNCAFRRSILRCPSGLSPRQAPICHILILASVQNATRRPGGNRTARSASPSGCGLSVWALGGGALYLKCGDGVAGRNKGLAAQATFPRHLHCAGLCLFDHLGHPTFLRFHLLVPLLAQAGFVPLRTS